MSDPLIPSVCIPPYHTPLVNTEGLIAEPWALFFSCLVDQFQPGGNIQDPGGRPRSRGSNCSVTTIFQGQTVCLSPFPFSQNPISGVYLTNLYNFLNSIPGAWDFGCLQGGYYIWPWVDEDPRPTLPIPASWAPYLIVTGTISPYVGSFIIHRDDVCPA